MRPMYQFRDISPTWEAAKSVVDEWLPGFAGSLESRVMVANAKRLLTAVVLHFRTTKPSEDRNLENVHSDLQQAMSSFDEFLTELSNSPCPRIASMARELAAERSNPYYGGLAQAVFCLEACRRQIHRRPSGGMPS